MVRLDVSFKYCLLVVMVVMGEGLEKSLSTLVRFIESRFCVNGTSLKLSDVYHLSLKHNEAGFERLM